MLGAAGCLAPEVLGKWGLIPAETGLVRARRRLGLAVVCVTARALSSTTPPPRRPAAPQPPPSAHFQRFACLLRCPRVAWRA